MQGSCGRVGPDAREQFTWSIEQHLQSQLVTGQRRVVHRVVTLVVPNGCYGVIAQQVLDDPATELIKSNDVDSFALQLIR